MKSRIKLSVDDIQAQNENALDLFYSGIKSKETKRTMERYLKEFLVDVCTDLLNGDFCKICTTPASERQLVIDHIDNDNTNNLLSNLQLLCRRCNYRKNPRRPVATSVSSIPVALRIGQSREPDFRKFVYEEMVWRRSYTFKELVHAGAERAGISPVTATRYLNKMLSETGALQRINGVVRFKERSVLIEILSDFDREMINHLIESYNEEVTSRTSLNQELPS